MSYEPLFAHLLHIRPWEIELLSIEQFERHVAWIDDYQRQQQEAARGD